jgi:ATP-dependent Lon protease
MRGDQAAVIRIEIIGRRWSTSEPCHAFLAISRTHVANPIVLVDEVDKAADRRDYGRLWDGLLSFLETETARAYPDPALEVELDLSHVSFLMTANATARLPSPLLDRLRIVDFPRATADHLEALAPAVVADIAQRAGFDPRFVEPLTGEELSWLRQSWRGVSVRRLARMVEVIIRARDRGRSRH